MHLNLIGIPVGIFWFDTCVCYPSLFDYFLCLSILSIGSGCAGEGHVAMARQ